MTEPRLNADGSQQKLEPSQQDTQAQAQPAPVAQPIADKPAEPKAQPAPIARKKRSVPLPVVAVVTVILLAIAGLITWRIVAMSSKPTAAPDLAAATGTAQSSVKAEAKGPLAPFAKGSLAKLTTYETPAPIESIAFADRNGKAVQLSDFKGQVVVLNVWATWCAPCRVEMPTLAHLQTLYADKPLKVLPLSVDTEEDFPKVKSFMDVQQPLEIYVDTKFQAPSKLKVGAMPGTFIIDKQGRLVARLDGEASWDTPDVRALVDKLLAE